MDLPQVTDRIINLVAEHGPMTGKELVQLTGLDVFPLWKSCQTSERLSQATIGRRYLRLDRQVEGYARLSPSILREFLGYTVIGLQGDQARINEKAASIHQAIREVSRDKFELARQVAENVVKNQPDPAALQQHACFLIAGDVAYGMAHLEPRPESSTGKLVNGSDLDIVVVTDQLPPQLQHSLDDAIYSQKYMLLRNPIYNEEIDYIIKDLSRVQEQLKFDRFESMVAVKILHEGLLLCGSRILFDRIKALLQEHGIPERITRLEEEAALNRQARWDTLIQLDRMPTEEENSKLLYTMEEAEEFI